jgi:ribokinase
MMQVQPKVVCLGSLNMDLLIQVQHAPADGETVVGQSIQYVPGGKGANQAVSCARQGSCVSMLGRVGADSHGTTLRNSLSQEGISVDGIDIDPSEPTGIALVLLDEHGNNRIVVIAGANGKFHLDENQLSEQLSQEHYLVMQFEVPIDQVLQAAKVAHKLGCKVVLNPSPVKSMPQELWSLVDTLIVNETEAHFLTGLCAHADVHLAAEAGRCLRAKGVSNVVVTLGALGAVATDAAGSTHHPATKVPVLDTTAAGDTFLGAVTVALASKQSLTDSVALGISAAALCVQHLGAQPSIPTHAQTLACSAPPWRVI